VRVGCSLVIESSLVEHVSGKAHAKCTRSVSQKEVGKDRPFWKDTAPVTSREADAPARLGHQVRTAMVLEGLIPLYVRPSRSLTVTMPLLVWDLVVYAMGRFMAKAAVIGGVEEVGGSAVV